MAANSQSEERREPTMESGRGSGKSRKKKRKGKRRSLIGRMAYWSLVLGLWAFIGAIGVIGWVAAHLPPIQSLEVPKRPPSIQIVGLNGRVLATRGEMGGSAVPLRELPLYLPKAFLAIEDRRFYSHYGIDPFGVSSSSNAFSALACKVGSIVVSTTMSCSTRPTTSLSTSITQSAT